jgi:hypothetical protein
MLADVLAIHHNINLADVSPHADVHHVMYIAVAELTARLISVIAPAGMVSWRLKFTLNYNTTCRHTALADFERVSFVSCDRGLQCCHLQFHCC